MTSKELVAIYLKLRDRRAQRKKEYEIADDSDKAHQEKIETMFLKKFQEEGTNSASTDEGTVYTSTRVSASVADWTTLLPFIREHELWQMLEKRVSKTAIEEYVAANEDLPPGVNMSREIVVNVRRS